MLQIDKVIVGHRFKGWVRSHDLRLVRHIQTELYCELKSLKTFVVCVSDPLCMYVHLCPHFSFRKNCSVSFVYLLMCSVEC